MNSFEKHHYRLILSDKEGKRIIERKEQHGQAVRFCGKVNEVGVPKIYILKK